MVPVVWVSGFGAHVNTHGLQQKEQADTLISLCACACMRLTHALFHRSIEVTALGSLCIWLGTLGPLKTSQATAPISRPH